MKTVYKLPSVLYEMNFSETPFQLTSFPYRCDGHCELVAITSGQAEITIDNQFYEVGAGDYIAISPEQTISVRPFEGGICGIGFAFLLSALDSGAGILPPHPVMHSDSPVQFAMFEMLLSLPQGDPSRGHILYAILAQMEQNEPVEPFKTLPIDSAAYRMYSYINRNYTEDLTLEDIRGHVNLTASHAIHVFKPVFGTSPMQMLGRRRIGQAQFLLRTTRTRTQKISSDIGISNTNYFYTVFRKQVGIPPNAYREQSHLHITIY